MMSIRLRLPVLILSLLLLSACVAEVGSERWCKQMKGKPKGDWTLSEARDYAEHCLL